MSNSNSSQEKADLASESGIGFHDIFQYASIFIGFTLLLIFFFLLYKSMEKFQVSLTTLRDGQTQLRQELTDFKRARTR